MIEKLLLKANRIWLCPVKKIALLRFFENEEDSKKKYIRNLAVEVDGHIVTSRIEETFLFMEELSYPGSQENTEFLHLVNDEERIGFCNFKEITISIPEAKIMRKTMEGAMHGYSMVRALDYDFEVTPEMVVELLDESEKAS